LAIAKTSRNEYRWKYMNGPPALKERRKREEKKEKKERGCYNEQTKARTDLSRRERVRMMDHISKQTKQSNIPVSHNFIVVMHRDHVTPTLKPFIFSRDILRIFMAYVHKNMLSTSDEANLCLRQYTIQF
jgi:hypothetical protein